MRVYFIQNAKVILGVDATNEQIELKAKELEAQFVLEKKQKELNTAIQNHLDNKAKKFRYNNIMSARSYAGYKNPFQPEAQKLAIWASNCWVKAGQIEADVQAGNREMPTIDEVLNELPIFV